MLGRFNDDHQHDRFHRDFRRAQTGIGAMALVALIVWLGALGGIGFVVYKVLVHFGIL